MSARSRVSQAQWFALQSVLPGGHLAETDRRVLHALRRRGWAQEESYRRGRTRWAITRAGRDVLASSPEIVSPRPRTDWANLTYRELGRGHYIAAEHEVYRPEPGMLWRVICPADSPDQPLGYEKTKPEAVALLVHHYYGRSCAWSQSTNTSAITLSDIFP